MMIVSPSKSIRTMMNTGKIFLKSSLSAAGKAAAASVVATLFSLCHAVEKDVVVIVSQDAGRRMQDEGWGLSYYPPTFALSARFFKPQRRQERKKEILGVLCVFAVNFGCGGRPRYVDTHSIKEIHNGKNKHWQSLDA
jgi:hypothetical protein